MENFSKVREISLQQLAGSLAAEGRTIDEGFTFLEAVIDVLALKSGSDNRASLMVATLLKARNFERAIYTLALEGLAQEAGALLRPLTECIDLLSYLRLVHDAPEKILQGRLPKAGDIAAKVGGPFKNLREHLNEHASHFAATAESLFHVANLRNFSFQKEVVNSPKLLRYNLGSLFIFQALVGIEAFESLKTFGLMSELLQQTFPRWVEQGLHAYDGYLETPPN